MCRESVGRSDHLSGPNSGACGCVESSDTVTADAVAQADRQWRVVVVV